MLRRGTLPSRVLALVLLVAAVFGAYSFVVDPILAAYRKVDESIARSHMLLQRYHDLAARRADLSERLARQEEALAEATGYLEGTSDALAAASLQDRVKDVVEAAGGTLRSTQILPAKEVEAAPGVRRVALRLRLIVSIEALEEILYELETGQPYLFVGDLSIRNQKRRRRRNEADQEPLLDVGLEVFGYARAAEA